MRMPTPRLHPLHFRKLPILGSEELPILGSEERCKPLSRVRGLVPGAKNILKEIEAKTSINHSLTARFSNEINYNAKL